MTLADTLGLSGAKALARSLRGKSLRVVALGGGVARALEQAGHTVENGESEHADALCLSGVPEVAFLRQHARSLKPGGQVLVATSMAGARRERHLIMALLLHAGFIDLEQRWSRGILISCGRLRGDTHLP
jgi:hypothetical protein